MKRNNVLTLIADNVSMFWIAYELKLLFSLIVTCPFYKNKKIEKFMIEKKKKKKFIYYPIASKNTDFCNTGSNNDAI